MRAPGDEIVSYVVYFKTPMVVTDRTAVIASPRPTGLIRSRLSIPAGDASTTKPASNP